MAIAAVVLGWLESRPAVIVYNGTQDRMDQVTIQVGGAVWAVGDLAPGDSRRWHPPAEAKGDVTITTTSWPGDRPAIMTFDPRRTRILILRLGTDQTVTSSTEQGWWQKLSDW